MASSQHEHSTVDYATPRRRGLPRAIVVAIQFLVAWAACTTACAVLWECFVTDVLYHCTDAVGLDYLSGPGGWVHGAVAGQPGNYGDTIRAGWSIGRLTALWLSLHGASILVSLGCSRMRFDGATRSIEVT